MCHMCSVHASSFLHAFPYVDRTRTHTTWVAFSFLGRYVSCLETPRMKYYIGQLLQHTETGKVNEVAREGVCVPEYCNTDDVTH